MEVAHGCLEGIVSHRLLNGPRVGSSLEAMRGITVPQFMWQDRDAQFTSGWIGVWLFLVTLIAGGKILRRRDGT